MGHTCTVDAGLGLPNRWRHEAATALRGFQLAMVRNHAGMPWVGTNALETKDRGRNTMNPIAWAASGLRSNMPAQAPAHVMANAMSSDNPIARAASATPRWMPHPTARPVDSMAMVISTRSPPIPALSSDDDPSAI